MRPIARNSDFDDARHLRDRTAMRLPVGIKATFREQGLNRMDVDVVDLSATGFCITTVYRVRVGQRVWLAIPGLKPMEAMVRWSNGQNHGCEFASPMHPAVVDHIHRLFPHTPN
jgi:hypothetical protein